jgi:tetratricopeptide (TPR) repeat protein
LTPDLRSQFLCILGKIAAERGDLDVALDFAHRAVHHAREDYAADPRFVVYLKFCLIAEADILDSLGRLDEALALDAERLALEPDKPDRWYVRMAREKYARNPADSTSFHAASGPKPTSSSRSACATRPRLSSLDCWTPGPTRSARTRLCARP